MIFQYVYPFIKKKWLKLFFLVENRNFFLQIAIFIIFEISKRYQPSYSFFIVLKENFLFQIILVVIITIHAAATALFLNNINLLFINIFQ